MSLDRILREQARLIMLRAVGQQTNECLNSDLLVAELKPFGIRKDRAWVHGELAYMAEMGAVTLLLAGSVQVACLTELGRRHLDRDVAIEGIQRPSRPGG